MLNGVKGKGDYGTSISKDMEDRSCNMILDLISVVRNFLKFLSLSWPIYLPYLKVGHDLFPALNILLCDQLSSYSFQIFFAFQAQYNARACIINSYSMTTLLSVTGLSGNLG